MKSFYKILIALTIAGFLLMAGLVVTGLTLARTTRDMAEPEVVAVASMISLSPTYGGANTLINITGMGFPENSRVSLNFAPSGVNAETQPYAEALTDAEGMFSVMFSMPSTWPDGSAITDENLVFFATARDTAETGEEILLQATANFQYRPVIQPEISISPTHGEAGAVVTVTSVGFPPNQQVGLYIGMRDGSRELALASMAGATDASGQLNQTLVMPELWPDGTRIRDEQLEIVALTMDGAVRASAGFDYEPFPYPLISVSPNYGGPDTPVSITGDGFPAGARVLIKVGTSVDDGASKTAYLEVRADLQGYINVLFTMPGYWPNGLPILNRDVVVLATDSQGRGYGWMGFAYLTHAAVPLFEQGSSAEVVQPTVQTGEANVSQSQPANNGSNSGNPAPSGSGNAGAAVVPQDSQNPPDISPSIQLVPSSGGADTVVQINGSGFHANTPLTIYLGLPATGLNSTSLGSVVTDDTGSFSFQLTMPAAWPDGAPIVESNLVVVVVNGDASAKAGAEFQYIQTPIEEPTAVDVCDVLPVLAAASGLSSEQIDARPSPVIDPRSSLEYAGCTLQFQLSGLQQSPLDLMRIALIGAGWQEAWSDPDTQSIGLSNGNSLLFIYVEETTCLMEEVEGSCPTESAVYTIRVDYIRDTQS